MQQRREAEAVWATIARDWPPAMRGEVEELLAGIAKIEAQANVAQMNSDHPTTNLGCTPSALINREA